MGKLFAGTEAIIDNRDIHENNHFSCACHPSPLEHGYGEVDSRTIKAFQAAAKAEATAMAAGCGHSHTTSEGWIDKTGAAFTHAMDDFLAVGHYLVIGAFIAALAQTYVDRSSFLSLTAMPALAVVLMMILAILLNLCSEADAFIAASFQGLLPMPAQMAFMLTGPMFDLKLLLMYQSVFTRRAIVVIASLILVAVLAIALGLEMLHGALR
jgi:uncharacterized membrane protein YraQ (UPF0718 family)